MTHNPCINFVPANTGDDAIEALGFAHVCGDLRDGVHITVDRYRDGRFMLQVVRQRPDPASEGGVLCDELARAEWSYTEPHLVVDGAEIIARCVSYEGASEIAVNHDDAGVVTLRSA